MDAEVHRREATPRKSGTNCDISIFSPSVCPVTAVVVQSAVASEASLPQYGGVGPNNSDV